MTLVSVKTVTAVGVLLNFLDSLTTYYILVAGVGREANPLLAPLYHQNPLMTFFVFIITSAAVVKAVYAALTVLSGIGRALYRVFMLMMFVIIVVKAAVVVNNICVIAVGQAPVVRFFEIS
jgi:phosphoglycerol transferase MdoB-like AlkP superfamily enzyme